MKAVSGLLAVLLTLSCISLAQTPQTQTTAPAPQPDQAQQAVPAEQTAAAPVQQAAPAQQTDQAQPLAQGQQTDQAQAAAPAPPADQAQQTVPTPSTDQTQAAIPAQTTAPVQQAVAGGDVSKHEAEGQASAQSQSLAASTNSAYAAMANAADVPASSGVPTVPFAPGAKIFIEPMNGFEEYLAREIVKKKVPVVLVHDRLEADFILSGDAHVHKREFFTSFVLTTKGKGDVSIRDAHTGNEVFTHKFKRADGNMTPYLIYDGWAVGCAKDMRKTLEPKKKK